MKRKIRILNKLLIFGITFMLLACEKDLYEQPIKQSKYKMRIVNSSELEKNSSLMNKIEKSNFFNKSRIKKNNVASRIIHDSISGYYLDTDNVKYLEGEGFKSYTFEVIKPDKTFLDNLVLISKYGGEYKPYALRYTLTEDEIKKLNTEEYIDFTNKCKASEIEESNSLEEILAKFSHNDDCNMVYTWVETVTIIPCPRDGCYQDPWVSYEYGHVLVGALVCSEGGSGGAGGDIGQIGTSPHGGGGNSSNNPPQTPCETLNDAIQNASVNQAIQNLKSKTVLKKEYAYQIERRYNSQIQTYNYTPTLKTGDDFNTVVSVGGYIKGQGHNHPINGQSIPSIVDLHWLMSCQTEIYPTSANGYNIVVVPNPDSPNNPSTAIVYAVTVTNLATLTNQMNTIFGANFDSLSADDKNKLLKEKNDEYGEKFQDVQDNTNSMEQRFLSLYANFGISLYKYDNNTNNWNKLNLTNNTVTPQPCE